MESSSLGHAHGGKDHDGQDTGIVSDSGILCIASAVPKHCLGMRRMGICLYSIRQGSKGACAR